MMRVAVIGLLAMTINACVADFDDDEPVIVEEVGEAQQEVGGNMCVSSYQCGEGRYCTVEDGVCLSPPQCNKPGVFCTDVCHGRCKKAKNPCGGCPAGNYCMLCQLGYACIPDGAVC